MEKLNLREIIEVVNGETKGHSENLSIESINTDSRKKVNNSLFIALVGENFDGHDFVEGAVKNGAVAVIVSKTIDIEVNVPIIKVKDTLKALWEIASFYRQKLSKKVVAVTGSVGKTSTKDMISTVLSVDYNVHKSKGNFNNHIGMPITVLGMENEHDIMVVEMGMRGFGEIRELTNIAKPNIAVITNIGISHIERLGSKENILKAKLEIAEGLDDKNGVLVLNANDPYLKNVDKNVANKIIYIGIDVEADYTAYSVVDMGEKGIQFKVKINDKEYKVETPALGTHNVYNALYAIACGVELGMNIEGILEGIKRYKTEGMRLNIVEKDGITFINDCYNASPDSMKAGLQVLDSLSSNSRGFAILGNMFELGDMAKKAHYEVGKMCNQYNVYFTAVIGENAKDVGKGIDNPSKYKIFKTHEDIVNEMKNILKSGDVVLIKGSRGMEMEKILELW